MSSTCLFLVQDDNRPMYVLAETWQEAVDKWRRVIQEENAPDDCSDEQPKGVQLVAEPYGVIQ